MKLTHVFGLVAAVHLAAFTVIFATPGCRSSGKPKPRPEQTDPAAAPAGVPVDNLSAIPVASMSDADINAAAPSAAPVGLSPVSSAAPAAPAAEGTVRFAPSRPGSAVDLPAPAAAPAPSGPSATHTVAKGESLWTISRKYGVTIAELAAANKLSPSATLRLGQQLAVPAKAAAPSAAPAGDVANTYEVKAGDTLGAIARRQGTTVAALRTANNLSGDNLRVGQKLVIPGNAAPLSASTEPAAFSSGPAPAPAPAAPRAGSLTHSVVSGDTLGSIARSYGVRVGEIATLNNITDPAKLRVGQVLKLPSSARAGATSARPATTSAAPAASPLATRVEEPAPVTPIVPVEPVEPVSPVAVPIIRIE